MTTLLRTKLIVATLLTLGACSVERTEVKRVISPDHETVAILVRDHVAGAVGDMKFYVYLVKADGEQELDHPNVTVDDCGGISPVWKDKTTLHLEYDAECYIRQFSNRWYEMSVVSDDQQRAPPVEIVLIRASGKDSAH